MKKIILFMVLFGGLLGQLPMAEAGRHRHDHAGAVAAGILGLGLGMAIAAPRVYHQPDYYDRHVVIEHRHSRPWRHPDRYYRRHYDRDHDWNDYRPHRRRFYDD